MGCEEDRNEKRNVKMAGVLLFVLAVASAGPLVAQSQRTTASSLSGIWVNTSYNGDSAAALLVWTEDGVLTSWDQSYDNRCAGESRVTVSDAWLEGGYTYVEVAAVNAFLGGVELRVSYELYRMRRDENVLERIGVSPTAMPRSAAVDTTDPFYRIWYRQRPVGLTPRLGRAAMTGQM
jgi:hypothetical protein